MINIEFPLSVGDKIVPIKSTSSNEHFIVDKLVFLDNVKSVHAHSSKDTSIMEVFRLKDVKILKASYRPVIVFRKGEKIVSKPISSSYAKIVSEFNKNNNLSNDSKFEGSIKGFIYDGKISTDLVKPCNSQLLKLIGIVEVESRWS